MAPCKSILLISMYDEFSGYTLQFLLSEHILCKESIVIVKKFDFEILTYLYVLMSPEFIYAIFGVMYVCMCVCAYVRACLREWTR